MISNIEQCQHQLVFALKLKVALENDRILQNQLDIGVALNQTSLEFSAYCWRNKEDILLLAENTINMSIAALVIATDEELDEHFGDKDPTRIDHLFSLRAIIYQIRNAFAHSLLKPRFQVKKKYRRIYSVQIGNRIVKLDFNTLDAKLFSYEIFGGFDVFGELIDLAKDLVSKF